MGSERWRIETNEIANEFGISANILSRIWKNKEKLQEAYGNSNNGTRKRVREGDFKEVCNCVLHLFKQVRNNNIPANGSLLCKKLNVKYFKTSTGWLDDFKTEMI